MYESALRTDGVALLAPLFGRDAQPMHKRAADYTPDSMYARIGCIGAYGKGKSPGFGAL